MGLAPGQHAARAGEQGIGGQLGRPVGAGREHAPSPAAADDRRDDGEAPAVGATEVDDDELGESALEGIDRFRLAGHRARDDTGPPLGNAALSSPARRGPESTTSTRIRADTRIPSASLQRCLKSVRVARRSGGETV